MLTLEKLPSNTFTGRPGPLLLIVMDGVGIGKQDDSNAVYVAKTPTLDKLFGANLYCQLQAHGKAVGLPSDDDMGNSEIGHNALGAGRVFDQGAKLVNKAIETASMFDGEVWKQAVEAAKAGHTMHFIGLHSDGNVHSNISQLYPMLKRAAADGVKSCRVHILLDGRDVPAKSALVYIEKTEAILAEINAQYGADFRIASGGGRMITTMDRYQADWAIVERGWKAHVLGQGRPFENAAQAVQAMYDEDGKATDQYLQPFVINKDGKPVGTIENGDSVVFFNFRGDRAIEISMAFEGNAAFDKFDRIRVPEVYYAGIMQYDGDLKIPTHFLVNPPQIDRTFCEYLCDQGVKMFAISETQKFGHVTYFWNGNKSGYINEAMETYKEIPSDKIEFDKAPKMKAIEITDWVIDALKSGKYQFGRLNLANGDMVGHTGNMEAAVEAVETVDQCVARMLEEVQKLGGIALITADHGNCDTMWTEKNGVRSPKTAHTLNPVPFCIFDPNYQGEYEMSAAAKDTENKPGLSNVAATVMNLLGYKAPDDYRPSLIEFK